MTLPSLYLPEPIRVFSDLHLGHQGSLIKDIQQIEPLFEGTKSLIFNGDTYEQRSEQYRRKGDYLLHELKKRCMERSLIPYFIRGNHDPNISDLAYLDIYQGKIFITHGDLFFYYGSPWGRELRTGKKAIEQLYQDTKSEELNDLEARLELTRKIALASYAKPIDFSQGIFRPLSLLREMWPPTRPFTILNTWLTSHRKAIRITRTVKPEAQVIIYGHTHFPTFHKTPSHYVINTGGYLHLPFKSFVEIDQGTLSIYSIHQTDKGVFQKGALKKQFAV